MADGRLKNATFSPSALGTFTAGRPLFSFVHITAHKDHKCPATTLFYELVP